MASRDSSRNGTILVARVLLVAAFAVALYLASISMSGGNVAGCGPDSNCHRVLNSRWSSWFGIPVSLFATATYLILFVTSFQIGTAGDSKQESLAGKVTLASAVVVLGAAIWFAALQFFVIQSVCPFCMAAHDCGATAVLILLGARGSLAHLRPGLNQAPIMAGFTLLALLTGGQLLYRPATFVIQTPTTTPKPLITPASITSVERVLAIHEGRFQLKLRELPLMGSPEAPKVIVRKKLSRIK